MSSKKGLLSSTLKLTILAKSATATPPIGPALGQKGIRAIEFCKQFNEQSSIYKDDIPLRCEISCNPDRTFSFQIGPPSTTFLLKRAAGIEKASSSEVVAKINAKQLYEIAKIKSKDPKLKHLSLQSVYRMILSSSRKIGIEVNK